MKYKRRSTGEEKVQKIAAEEEGNYRIERVPPKADWLTSQIPGWGFVYKRQCLAGGSVHKKDAIWHPDINPPYPIQAVFLECFL